MRPFPLCVNKEWHGKGNRETWLLWKENLFHVFFVLRMQWNSENREFIMYIGYNFYQYQPSQIARMVMLKIYKIAKDINKYHFI